MKDNIINLQEIFAGRKRNRRITCIGTLLTLVYIGLCVPNSIELSRKLDPLRERFKQVVEVEGYNHAYVRQGFDDRYIELDYNGRLDKIIAERDKILDANYGISGDWRSMDYLFAEINPFVFCYNPFHEVE